MDRTPTELIDLTADAACEGNKKKAIGLAKGLGPESVLSFAINHGWNQIVQISTKDFQAEVRLSTLMLSEGRRYLQFPLSAVLDPDQADQARESELTMFKRDFSKLEEKGTVIEELQACLSSVVGTNLIGEIILVGDEMFTNAIFHAPDPDREIKGISASEKHATLFCGWSESRLVLGCSDLYGSLPMAKLLARILDCYKQGVSKVINMAPDRGAGIGLFLLFDSCTSLYLGIDPGKQTTVCCSFPLKMSGRKRREMDKNLHLLICE